LRLIEELASLSRRGLFTGLAVLAALALTTAFVAPPAERVVRDILVTTASPFTAPPGEIVLVTITEETLERFPYRSPIDRAFLADLVRTIAAAGPKAIGIDLLFDQPTEPQKDRLLARAIEAAPVPVVIATASREDGLSDAQFAYLTGFAPSAMRGLAVLGRDPFDGVVRQTFPGREVDGEWWPGFAPAVAMAGGLPGERERRELAYFHDGAGEPHAFPAYPAHAAALLPAAWFKDKFVLIGVDLPLDDRHATPFVAVNGVAEGTLPGVVIHAHALAQDIAGATILAPGLPAAALLFLVAGGVSGWLAWRPLPVVAKPLLIIAVLAGIWAIGLTLFARQAVLVPLVAPSFLVAGLSALIAFLAWKRDSDERRFIERAFAQYVSPAVVETIVRDPKSLRLGGEKRLITCVFTDLEGFTAFSEGLAPERLADILNAYLDEVCGLFVGHGATIDKVIGDAVVGFVGAPTEQPDGPARAVALALAIQEFSARFRRRLRSDGGPELGTTRVGVHCGPAIVGNFGGKRFFNYTAIGDTVNTAARLEGANKFLGTSVCISGEVAARAQGFLLREAGTIQLKGKSEGLTVYEPLRSSPEARTLSIDYAAAFDRLRSGEESARQAFDGLACKYPQDPLIAFHRRRLAAGEVGAKIVLTQK